MVEKTYDPRNATAGWHGFVHQGKVGIFIALKEIAALLENNVSSDVFNNYFLEYESDEDIDIRHNEQIISRHQVKAYKDGVNRSRYQDVFEKFEIYYNENVINDDCRFLHTVVEVHDFYNPEKLESYPDENNIQLYKYPDNNEFCSITEDTIKKHCDVYIAKILHKLEHSEVEKDIYRDYVYYQLLHVLDSRIRRGHINDGMLYPTIEFSELFQIVCNNEDIEDYYIEEIRIFFFKRLDKFLNDTDFLESGNVNERQVFKIRELVNEIVDLTDTDFIKFLLKINPHVHFDFEKDNIDLAYYRKLTNEESLDDIFLDLLYRVLYIDFDYSYPGYDIQGGYYLTLLNNKPSRMPAKIKYILSNSSLSADLFNKRYIINGHLTDYPLDQVFSEPNLKNNWDFDVKNKDSIVYSNAEFISVDDTIEKLNEKGELNG